MHQFDYLSIFVSLIIAIGVTHLLSSGSGLIRFRGKVRLHVPTLIWMAALLLIQIQIWWGSYYRREIEGWTFFGFLFYLLIPIVASMLGFLLIPTPEPGADLVAEYDNNRKWFFGLLTGLVILSLLEDIGRSRVTYLDFNFGLRLGIGAVSVTGFLVGSKSAQLPIAVVFLILMLAHITFGFWTLPQIRA